MAKKKLTPFQSAQKKAKRAKEKAARDARRLREKLQADARRAKKKDKSDRHRARLVDRKARKVARQARRMAPKHSLKAWAEAVAEAAGHKCEVCGAVAEAVLNPDGTPKLTKDKLDAEGRVIRKGGRPVWRHLDANHILPKEYFPEHKYDVKTGILLCKQNHHYSCYAFHTNPLWFALWLARHKRPQFDYIKRLLGGDCLQQGPAMRQAMLNMKGRHDKVRVPSAVRDGDPEPPALVAGDDPVDHDR